MSWNGGGSCLRLWLVRPELAYKGYLHWNLGWEGVVQVSESCVLAVPCPNWLQGRPVPVTTLGLASDHKAPCWSSSCNSPTLWPEICLSTPVSQILCVLQGEQTNKVESRESPCPLNNGICGTP